MSFPSVTNLIPVLQIAIGPVILISGVGLLLLTMTNRLGRAIDRARTLYEKLRIETPADQDRTRAQLRILQRRANFIRQAIILATVSILLAALLIISLFFAALLRLDVGWLILLSFSGCLLALIGSLLAFIRDVNQSLLALKLELGDELTQAGSPR
jgi:CBS domain containing-hemolysin-like protein